MTTLIQQHRTGFLSSIGTPIANLHTARAAVESVGLDYQVAMRSLETVVPMGEGLPSFGVSVPADLGRAVVRTDTEEVLGIHGARYTPTSFADFADMVDALAAVEGHELPVDMIWLRNGGRSLVLSLDFPADLTIAGDVYTTGLLAKTSHDGSQSMGIASRVRRLACTNEVAGVFATAAHRIAAKHTASGAASFAYRAGTVFALQSATLAALRQTADQFLAVPLSMGDACRVVDRLMNVEQADTAKGQTRRMNAAAELLTIYRSSTTVENVRGTGWGLIQAVNEYEQWIAPTRGAAKAADRVLAAAVEQDAGKLTRRTMALLR